MRKVKIAVASEPSEAAIYPRLLSFPQGVPVDHADMTVDISVKGTGKKRKVNVEAELNGVTFKPNDGNEAIKNDYFKFAVGFVDETTGVMTVYPAEHTYVMRPVVTGREDVLRSSAASYEAKRQSLTEEFGSRKKKRALAAAQSNSISAENISGATAVEQAIIDSIEEVDDKTSAIVSAADQALEQNRIQLLPPYDESADALADCYPLDKFILGNVSSALSDLYDSILQNNSSNDEPVTASSSKKELSDIFLTRFEDGTNSIASLMVGFHAAFHPSLPSQLKKSDKKSIKSKIVLVLLLEYMLWMYREISSKYNKTISQEELVAALEDAPTAVFRYLTDSFTSYKKANGKPSYVCSKTQSDKMLLHIIVLALHISNFSLDLTTIAQDLKLPASTLSTLARETGCRVIKPKSVSEAGESHLVAELMVPLKFPKRMGGKQKGR